ncbi:hypothetical protein BBP40_004257 [Aspergillus hancockii]|nr:hypothetical protein BBP40_004257 [Aspergillus hancockii]
MRNRQTVLTFWSVCFGGQKLVANTIGKDQQDWNLQIQKSVKNTASVLGSMKAAKISGLSRSLTHNLRDYRKRELFVSRAVFKAIMWLNGLASLPRIWSSVITFIVYAVQAKIRGEGSLSTVKAFSSLSIITLVTTPAEKLLAVLPQLSAGMSCFQRIHEYMASQSTKDDQLGGGVLLSNDSPMFFWDEGEKGSPKMGVIGLNGPGVAIVLDNVTVLPSLKATDPALHNMSFKVKRGTLTVVDRPVGSGKTTLLKAILGELPYQSGTVSVYHQTDILLQSSSLVAQFNNQEKHNWSFSSRGR